MSKIVFFTIYFHYVLHGDAEGYMGLQGDTRGTADYKGLHGDTWG